MGECEECVGEGEGEWEECGGGFEEGVGGGG